MDILTQAELKKRLDDGTLSIQSPTGSPPRAWTEEEKANARSAMERIVELEDGQRAKEQQANS